MLSAIFHFIPALQVLIVIFHVVLNLDKNQLFLTYTLIALSMGLGMLNMLYFMSEHKLRQIEAFISDQSHEDIMLKKIQKVPHQSDEKMYQAFINVYFSCFKNQATQQLLILLNWGASLFVILYLVYPLISIHANGSPFVFLIFTAFIIGIFTLITYIYAIFLKTKVESEIIESHVVKKHLD